MTDTDLQRPLDELTPERAEAMATDIAERWNKDWALVFPLICQKTGLSMSDALAFYALGQIMLIADHTTPRVYHQNCKACQAEKEFHELQLDTMRESLRHMREDHGDPEDWKGAP